MRIAVLLSGRGSNFHAIHEAIQRGELDASIVAVISNRPDAGGLARAQQAGYGAHLIDHTAFANRAAHEAAVLEVLEAAGAEWIVLAGYMRLFTAAFVERYRNRIVNIHPSLLPAFPGTNAQYQALEHGVKWTGATVHLVTAELDGGPIVLQETVAVKDGDNLDMLAARILEREHHLYPLAIQLILNGGWRIEGRRFIGT